VLWISEDVYYPLEPLNKKNSHSKTSKTEFSTTGLEAQRLGENRGKKQFFATFLNF
jgi:hypothetical protein